MARLAQSKIINGTSWEVTPWNAMHGIKMQARLARMLGPALSAASGTTSIMEADVTGIVSALFSALDEDKMPAIISDLLHGTRVDGKDITSTAVFNEQFAANYAEMYQGLAFILTVNFGNFFELAASIGSPLLQSFQEDAASRKRQPAKTAASKKALKKPGRRGG